MGFWQLCFAFLIGSFALVYFMPGWISLCLMTLASYAYCLYEIQQLQNDKSAGGWLAIFFVEFAMFGISLGFLIRGGVLLNHSLSRFRLWQQIMGLTLVMMAAGAVFYGMLRWAGFG